MIERIKNNWPAKLIALGLASLLWLYVNTQANPQVEDVYSNIPVEVTGLAQDLALIAKPPSVQVRVAGSRTSLQALSQRDVRAFVDLTGLTQGSNLVPVNVVVPGTVTAVAVTPAQLNINVDQIVEAKWPITLKISGRLDEKFTYIEPDIRPDIAFVRGASQVLNEIKAVVTTVELTEEITEELLLQLPLEAVNQANLPVTTQVSINPQWIEVLIQVEERLVTKTVGVNFALTGEAAAGFQVAEIILEPKTVTVTGPVAVLEELEEVTVGEVELDGIQETVTIEKEVLLPEEVNIIEGEEISITIIVEEAEAELRDGEEMREVDEDSLD